MGRWLLKDECHALDRFQANWHCHLQPDASWLRLDDEVLRPSKTAPFGRSLLHQRARLGHLGVVKHLVALVEAHPEYPSFDERECFAEGQEYGLVADDGSTVLHEAWC